MTNAERQRRYRQRLRDNRAVYQVELDHDDLHRLIDAGLLSEESADSRLKVTRAIQDIVAALFVE